MFKCCVRSNSITRKTKARSKSDEDDAPSPFGSSRLNAVVAVEPPCDGACDSSTRTNKLNGNVSRLEEASSDSILDIGVDLATREISQQADENSSLGLIRPIESSDVRPIVGDKVVVVSGAGGESESSAENRIENVDYGASITSVVINEQRSFKVNLYDASAYIERTIEDGPEDEGDDSVFETTCPTENDAKRNAKSLGTVEKAESTCLAQPLK